MLAPDRCERSACVGQGECVIERVAVLEDQNAKLRDAENCVHLSGCCRRQSLWELKDSSGESTRSLATARRLMLLPLRLR